jgi:hypothetical protein
MSKFNYNLFGLLIASALVCSSVRAHAASSMTVAVVGFSSWSDALTKLRTSGVSGSSRLQLVVTYDDESNELLTCHDYVLQLEKDAAAAFSVGACDPITGQTELLLIDRHQLYSHLGGLSQPVTLTIPTAAIPPPKPVIEPTCWAVIGPTITDPDTHLPFTLNPAELGVATLTEPKGIGVQKIPFDHAWLLRVKQSDHLQELKFSLAPWSTVRRRGLVYDVPSGAVYQPLQLRCDDNDPLGPWTSDLPVVPRELATTDTNGERVVLTQSWRDDWVDVAYWVGNISFYVGGVPAFLGVPVTIVGFVHGTHVPVFIGPTLIGTGLVMLVGGWFLSDWAEPKKAFQTWGNYTWANADTPREPSRSSLASDLHFEGASVAMDPARGSATLALSMSF